MKKEDSWFVHVLLVLLPYWLSKKKKKLLKKSASALIYRTMLEANLH